MSLNLAKVELPRVSDALLPQRYKAAKDALAECVKIDECADWANKAQALASYARQAKQDDLRKMADRIQARAIRRCGELLMEIEPAKNQHGRVPTRASSASMAGLSDHQRKTALRVASLPQDEFDAAVESEDPSTVTELAERGTRHKPILNIGERNPVDVKIATEAQGLLERFEKFASWAQPDAAMRGSFPNERGAMFTRAIAVSLWCQSLVKQFKEVK